jgi:hypothetical protein
MMRRRRLWILGITTLALAAVLVVLDGRMQDAGGHGIVDFELAFTSGKAQEIIDAWGAKGHDAALASLWLDYLYLIAYALFLRLAIQAVGDGLLARGARLAAPAAAIALLPLIGAACDAVEDAFLLLVLGGHLSSAGPALAGAFATVKFACIAVAMVYLLVGLVAMALTRRGAPAR